MIIENIKDDSSNEQDKSFCNTVLSYLPFDYQNAIFFNKKNNQYLIKHDTRSLQLFHQAKSGELIFLQQFIFYNFIKKIRQIDIKENQYLGILFRKDFYIVLDYDEDHGSLKPIAYFNFNIDANNNFHISYFEQKQKISFTYDENLFYFVYDNNKIVLGGLKNSSFQWLYNHRQIPQNNFLRVNNNVHNFGDVFFSQTITLNCKDLISDKIICLKLISEKNSIIIFALIQKSVTNLVQYNSKIIDHNLLFISYTLDKDVLYKFLGKGNQKIKFEHVLTQNAYILDQLKHRIQKFYVFEKIERTFLMQGEGFIMLISKNQFGIIIFDNQVFKELSQKFNQTKLMQFPSNNQNSITKFHIKQTKNQILVQYNEIFCIFYENDNKIDMLYFNTHQKVIDIQIENRKIVIYQDKEQIVTSFIYGKETNLKENGICLNSLKQLVIEGMTDTQFPNEKTQQLYFHNQKTFLVEDHSIWQLNHENFYSLNQIQIQKTFQNSWHLGNQEDHTKILLFDFNENFFLFDTISNKLTKHSPGFQLSNYQYHGFHIDNDTYLLVSGWEGIYINKKTVLLIKKIKFNSDCKFTVFNSKIITLKNENTIVVYTYQQEEVIIEDITLIEDQDIFFLNLTSTKENLYIYEKSSNIYVYDQQFQLLWKLDVTFLHQFIKPDQKIPEKITFSNTDASIEFQLHEEFHFQKIAEYKTFEFQNSKYIFLILENHLVRLMKIYENNLIRININNPIAQQKEQVAYMRVQTSQYFAILQASDTFVMLMYMDHGKEHFKTLPSKEFFNCFLDTDKIYTLSVNQINIYKKQNPYIKLYSNPSQIEFTILLEDDNDTTKNFMLISFQNDEGQDLVQLLNIETGQQNLIYQFEPQQKLTLMKLLTKYSREKYLILLGYQEWIKPDQYISKWKIIHLDQFKLNQFPINYTIFLQQSAQDRNQCIRQAFELEDILFLCFENTIFQIQGNKVTGAYSLNICQITHLALKDNFLLIGDKSIDLKFAYFTQQRKELLIKAGIRIDGLIKNLQFQKGNCQRFMILTEDYQLNGYMLIEKEIFNQSSVLIQQYFSFYLHKAHMFFIPQIEDFQCVILDKFNRFYYFQTYFNNENQIIDKLKTHMQETLPYIGGFSPRNWMKNQYKFEDLNIQVSFIDACLLNQYLNQNSYFQKKFEEEIGYSQEKVFSKLQISMFYHDRYF